jgi:hypothetical protein
MQDGVQRGGTCVYCQNVSPNQSFCDSAKTVSEEIQHATATSKICNQQFGAEVRINW